MYLILIYAGTATSGTGTFIPRTEILYPKPARRIRGLGHVNSETESSKLPDYTHYDTEL
jgi:hypothetical protein